MADKSAALVQQKIWDPVSRLWHWLFATTVIGNWLLGYFMTFTTVRWHFYLGYSILGLLVFRLIWGFIGPHPIRFCSFFPTPTSVIAYLKRLPKRQPSGSPGHNPLGALSVLGLLLIVLAQAVSGLFIETDDFFDAGPLNFLVSSNAANWLNYGHQLLSWVVLAMVVLHLAAILFYLFWKRENLTTAMISGWKWVRRNHQDNQSNH